MMEFPGYFQRTGNGAAALGERLVTAEINPLFVPREGRGVVAADGVAVLS